MKKSLLFFAVACLAALFVSSAVARDPVVDLLVKKGIVSEDEIAAAEAEAVTTSWKSGSPDITMGGYAQANYSWWDDDANLDATFEIKRVFMWVRGYVADDWSVFVSWYMHNPMLIDATVTYEYADWLNLSGGQFLLPYSYEQLTSSSRIDTIERAQISGCICDHRDIGLRATGALMEGKVSYGAAVVNGNGINTTDDNDKKDFVGRLQVQPFLGSEGPLAGLLLAGAFQVGEQPMIEVDELGAEIDMGDENRTRYLGTVVWKYDAFKAQGEYAQEELEDSNITQDGYYFLATYDFPLNDVVVQPVAKYETYDPNDSVGDDETNITTVGVNVFFNPKSKVMLNYRIIDEEPEDIDNNEILAQWQHIF